MIILHTQYLSHVSLLIRYIKIEYKVKNEI